MTVETFVPATDKQLGYLNSLIDQVGLLEVLDGVEDLRNLSRKAASVAIDEYLVARKAQWAEAEKMADEAAATVLPEFALPEGYFTVQFGERYDGEETHRTFRVKDASSQSKLAGKRIISLLTGPDNTGDYMGVGFVTDQGVSVWKRFSAEGVMKDAIDILLGDVETAQMGYAMQSGNCYVCGRLLTEPESIKLGIGPVCRGG